MSRHSRVSRIARDYRSPLDVVLPSKEEIHLGQRRLINMFSIAKTPRVTEEQERPINEAEQLDGAK